MAKPKHDELDYMDREFDTAQRLTKLETKLDVIENNHLAHLQADITKLDNRLWYVVAGVAVTVLLGFVDMFFN